MLLVLPASNIRQNFLVDATGARQLMIVIRHWPCPHFGHSENKTSGSKETAELTGGEGGARGDGEKT